MKKNLSIRAIAITIGMFLATGVFAQSFKDVDKQRSLRASAKGLVAMEESDKQALTDIKSQNVKAFDHFSRNFSSASALSTERVGKGNLIAFNHEGDVIRVLYNKNGKLLYKVRSYSPEKLDGQITRQIEDTYPGYQIFGVAIDVTVYNKTAHLVMIKNRDSFKRVRVVNGDLDVYEEYYTNL